MSKILIDSQKIEKELYKIGLDKKKIKEELEHLESYSDGIIKGDFGLFVLSQRHCLNLLRKQRNILSVPDTSIKDLTPESFNVNVAGRIAYYRPPYTYNKEEKNVVGKYSIFWLKDNTGEIKVILWNERSEIVKDENFYINKVIRVINGYIKKTINEQIELHISSKGNIDLSPFDINPKMINPLKSKRRITNISELGIQTTGISIQGLVILKSDMINYSKGYFQKIKIKDNTGTTEIVFWNDDTEIIAEIEEGDYCYFNGVSVKSDKDGNPQLSSRTTTGVKIIDKKYIDSAKSMTPINQLRAGDEFFNITGIVITIEKKGEITLKNGEKRFLLKFIISDKTGMIPVVLWGQKALNFQNLCIGQIITLNKIIVRNNPYSNSFEINFKTFSNLIIDS